MHTHTRTHRSTTQPTRVRPHLRRRNGVIEAPREDPTVVASRVAVKYGWHAFGG